MISSLFYRPLVLYLAFLFFFHFFYLFILPRILWTLLIATVNLRTGPMHHLVHRRVPVLHERVPINSDDRRHVVASALHALLALVRRSTGKGTIAPAFCRADDLTQSKNWRGASCKKKDLEITEEIEHKARKIQADETAIPQRVTHKRQYGVVYQSEECPL